MFEANIENMNSKQLRNEVQLLRDELAMFKRSYEDMIYNLDSDNFGRGFTIEQNNMKSQLKATAEAITLMVSNTDLKTALENYSTVEMTSIYSADTVFVMLSFVISIVEYDLSVSFTPTTAASMLLDVISTVE